MMLDWNEYRKQLAAGVKEIGQLSPDTLKGYIGLSSAGQKTDLLGAKVRELIALAVAVTARCDGCITVHTEAAIRRGATREEIAEALGVAITVNAGAALVYSARVMDAVKEYPREPPHRMNEMASANPRDEIIPARVVIDSRRRAARLCVMAGGGRPSTTLPRATKESRGWPAFAGHDAERARHVGRASVVLRHEIIC